MDKMGFFFLALIKGMFCSEKLVSFLVSFSDGLNQDLQSHRPVIPTCLFHPSKQE